MKQNNNSRSRKLVPLGLSAYAYSNPKPSHPPIEVHSAECSTKRIDYLQAVVLDNFYTMTGNLIDAIQARDGCPTHEEVDIIYNLALCIGDIKKAGRPRRSEQASLREWEELVRSIELETNQDI